MRRQNSKKSSANIDLVKELVMLSFKKKYRGSVLYLLWYIINPLILVAALYFVFSNNIGSQIPDYAIYALIGVLHWNFFSSTTTEGMNSIFVYRDIVKKTAIDRHLIVMSTVFYFFILHVVTLSLVLLVLACLKGLHVELIFLPLILLSELLIALGSSMILSALASYARDVVSIWRNILFIGIFLTPIFYLKESSFVALRIVNSINPMSYIIEYSRAIILDGQMTAGVLFLFIIAVVFAAAAYYLFKRLIINVAERI